MSDIRDCVQSELILRDVHKPLNWHSRQNVSSNWVILPSVGPGLISVITLRSGSTSKQTFLLSKSEHIL